MVPWCMHNHDTCLIRKDVPTMNIIMENNVRVTHYNREATPAHTQFEKVLNNYFRPSSLIGIYMFN